ncbi:hypothetical protein [Arenicella xantha]|uniref:Rod shape-determining protein MreB n=1 Tax=Arenicella xantha TaxID=644221 RepID=A0A395JFA0_9GAMM|nr:hypothetical protein [Arenicella xantha]RBP44820.1 hypothetical protein DFR28_1252 [Arenicella xantha]
MFKSEIIYIEVYENYLKYSRGQHSAAVTLQPQHTFSSARLAIAEYEVVEKLLDEIVGYSKWKYFLKPGPTLIMNQQYLGEKLSSVEIKVLQELAYGAGAREVYIWQGKKLDSQDIENGLYKNS